MVIAVHVLLAELLQIGEGSQTLRGLTGDIEAQLPLSMFVRLEPSLCARCLDRIDLDGLP